MDRKYILDAIEANHWDVEETFIPEGIEVVDDESIMMIQNHLSNSIYANKVVKCRGESSISELVDRVSAFYKQRTYSWWLGPQDKPGLYESLLKQGWIVEDEYEGLAIDLTEWESSKKMHGHYIKEVMTHQDILDLVCIAAGIWGYDEKARLAAFNERKAYLELPERRGRFLLAYGDKRIPVAYANDRYSDDGSVLYLKGSATLPEYRGKGFYLTLVAYRLNAAKQKGAHLVTVQARVGQSEPILKKLGFHSYGLYHHLVRSEL